MDLSTVRNQGRLKPRREPYWHKLATGQFLGLRPSSMHDGGSWIARAYDAETRRQKFHSLGDFGDLPRHARFDAARKAAREWLDHVSGGGSTKPLTVKQACERYAGAHPDAGGYFRRFVYADAIARLQLQKLTKKQLTAWRERMIDARENRAPSSINRNMTPLRAALNAALDNGDVLNDHAWRVPLKPIKGAEQARHVYLDRDQRRALIDNMPADCADFARGLCALPLRPGALAALTVGNFDARAGKLVIGKDKAHRDRVALLPPATVALLKEQARRKLPGAPLFARADGSAWNKDAWKRPFKMAVRAADLSDNITAYALRHSTITDLVNAGVPTLTVAQLAGTSVAMIEKHYGRLLEKKAQEALAKLAL